MDLTFLSNDCIKDLSMYASDQPMSMCNSLVLELSFSALDDILGSIARILPFLRIEKITFMTKVQVFEIFSY